MSQKFIKIKEDFICGYCGRQVFGNGYTNHCPDCLFSRHMDIYPGDRAETCNGLMAPIGLEKKGHGFIVLHQCNLCRKITKTKTAANDNIGNYLTGML